MGPPDVEAAAARIDGRVRVTPTLSLPAGEVADVPVVLKLEQLQVTGTFKARGAFNLLISREVPPAGVVAASGGNFGLAIAHAARALGHPATVFVPATSPAAKKDGLRALGADVVEVDGYYPEALAAAERHLADHGGLWTHAYDLPEVVAGAGTVARELEGQASFDSVVVAVGGGGLIGGVAAWLRDRRRLVAVETEGTPTLHRALQAGEPVDVDVSGVAASALGAGRIGAHCWSLREWIDTSVLVTDDAVVDAQHALWSACRLVAEPGGAAALAALRSGAYVPDRGEQVAVLVCGANTDPAEVAG